MSALAKIYTYRVRWRHSPFPWRQLRSAVIPPPDHLTEIVHRVHRLEGRHDWASFTVTEPATASTERTLHRVRLRTRTDGVDIEFLGDGFVRYQVRRMVGALLEVANGSRNPDWLFDLVDNPRPGARIRTAPARGLTLERVYYRRPSALGGPDRCPDR
jgi:tRNA pseudouridine38-40 synthase